MKPKVRVFYRVETPSPFASLYAKTLQEAKDTLKKWGECPNGTPENKAYWKEQQARCKIVKVTEVTEPID